MPTYVEGDCRSTACAVSFCRQEANTHGALYRGLGRHQPAHKLGEILFLKVADFMIGASAVDWQCYDTDSVHSDFA